MGKSWGPQKTPLASLSRPDVTDFDRICSIAGFVRRARRWWLDRSIPVPTKKISLENPRIREGAGLRSNPSGIAVPGSQETCGRWGKSTDFPGFRNWVKVRRCGECDGKDDSVVRDLQWRGGSPNAAWTNSPDDNDCDEVEWRGGTPRRGRDRLARGRAQRRPGW